MSGRLDELRHRANSALKERCEPRGGPKLFVGEPYEALALIELVEVQHQALKAQLDERMVSYTKSELAADALALYDNFNGGKGE